MVDEYVPIDDRRLEVRSTTRRHRALVRGSDAAVVLGVLGYSADEPGARVPAKEFLTRARAWQARHDPNAVRDPESAESIDWAPDPDAEQDYRHCPEGYRKVFSAFTMAARPPAANDWITWHHR
jgi:hypothetical protein